MTILLGETASPTKWNSLNLGSSHDETPWAVVMALIWEIVPTMLILLTIATRQGSRSTNRSRSMRASVDGNSRQYGTDGSTSGVGYHYHNIDGNTNSNGWTMGDNEGPGGKGLWSSSQHGEGQCDEIETAKRWLEGGDLFNGK